MVPVSHLGVPAHHGALCAATAHAYHCRAGKGVFRAAVNGDVGDADAACAHTRVEAHRHAVRGRGHHLEGAWHLDHGGGDVHRRGCKEWRKGEWEGEGKGGEETHRGM